MSQGGCTCRTRAVPDLRQSPYHSKPLPHNRRAKPRTQSDFSLDGAKGRHMKEKRIHQIFALSVILKGLHALVEIAGGIALYLTSTSTILSWINRFSQGQLTDDPHDWIASQAARFGQTFSVEQHRFYAFYLLTHGIVKCVLVYGLLRERLWAYPASFFVFGAFIAYQLYRYSFTHDFGLVVLSVFDVFVILLAVHEYRLLRRHLPTH
jgi:uncharacterized membrane protein